MLFITSVIAPAIAAGAMFDVSASPVVAVEGGPIILDVQLQYRGSESLTVDKNRVEGFVRIVPPPGWSPRRGRPTIRVLAGITTRVFSDTQPLYQTVYVHRNYRCNAPAGKVELKVRASVHADAPGGDSFYAMLTDRTVEVMVEHCTPEVMRRLTSKLEAELAPVDADALSRGEGPARVGELMQWVMGATRPEYGPLATRLLRYPASPQNARELVAIATLGASVSADWRDALVEHVASAPHHHAGLVLKEWGRAARINFRLVRQCAEVAGHAIALRPDFRGAGPVLADVVSRAADPGPNLTAAQLKRLAAAPNPLLQCLVALHLQHAYAKEWLGDCEQGLRTWANAPPEKLVADLVSKLTHPDQAIRVDAADRLGERIAVGRTREVLEQAAHTATGSERDEIGWVLYRSAAIAQGDLERQLLAELSTQRSELHRRMLATLQSGRQDSALVRAAKALSMKSSR